MLKVSVAIAAGAIALVAIVWILISGAPMGVSGSVFPILGPIIVVAAGLSTMAVKTSRQRRDGTAQPDSIERAVGIEVQASVMIDMLVAGLVLGLVLLISRSTPAALGVLVLVVFAIVDFGVRYTLTIRRLRAAK
jgi:Na+/H+-translocating membrane pyrophosphatase